MAVQDIYAPYTGFGYDYQTSVKFGILWPESNFPTWTSKPILTRKMVGNSGDYHTQFHGREPWNCTFRLLFGSIEEVEFFDAMVGQEATLWYRAGLGKSLDGTRRAIGGVDYLVLPFTTLDDINNETYEFDGHCEVSASFTHPYGDSAHYGFAVYEEEEE